MQNDYSCISLVHHLMFVYRTFNMDDFKRVYSNEEEAKSIPYFWEKFDPENYSIWFGEYKYNEELSKVFMSCNLIGGKLLFFLNQKLSFVIFFCSYYC